MRKKSYNGIRKRQLPIRINIDENNNDFIRWSSLYEKLRVNLYMGNIGDLTFERWLCPFGSRLVDLKNYYFYQVIEKLGSEDIWDKKIKEEKSIYMQLVNYVISFFFDSVPVSQIMEKLLSVSKTNGLYIDKLRKMNYVSTLTLTQLEITNRLINMVSDNYNCIIPTFSNNIDFIYASIQVLSLLYLQSSGKCISVLRNRRLDSSNIVLGELEMKNLFKNKDFSEYFSYLMESRIIFVETVIEDFGIKKIIDNLEKYSAESYLFSDEDYLNIKDSVDIQPNYDYFLMESKNKKLTDLFFNIRVFDTFGKLDTSTENFKAWEKLATGSSQLLKSYEDSNYEYKAEGCISDLFNEMITRYKDTYLISNYLKVFNDMDFLKVLSYLILSRNDVEIQLMTCLNPGSESSYVSKINPYNLYLALQVLIIDIASDIIDTLPLMNWARENDKKLYKELIKNPCVNSNFSIAVEYNKKLSEVKSMVVVAFPYMQKSIINNQVISDLLLERVPKYNVMYIIDCSIKSFLYKHILSQTEYWANMRVTVCDKIIKEIYKNCEVIVEKMGLSGIENAEINDTVIGYYIEEKRKEEEEKRTVRNSIELEEKRILKEIKEQIKEYGSIRELIENLKLGKIHSKSHIKKVSDLLDTPIEISGVKDKDGCIISFESAFNLVQRTFYEICTGNMEYPPESNYTKILQLLWMFYFKFEEDDINFPLAMLINMCRDLITKDNNQLGKILKNMEEFKGFYEYVNRLLCVFNGAYKAYKKKFKTEEDIQEFTSDEFAILKHLMFCCSKSSSAKFGLSPEVADVVYNSRFRDDILLDVNLLDSCLIDFENFRIQTQIDNCEFNCKITVNRKNIFVNLFKIKYNGDFKKLFNNDIEISNDSILGLLSQVNNDIIAWGKNGISLNKGKTTIDELVNPGILNSKIYKKFPKEIEMYVKNVQKWIGELLSENFITSFLAEGANKHREYVEKFARGIVNMHLNASYYRQHGFLQEKNGEDNKSKELFLAPEFYKLKKITSKQFNPNKIDLDKFKYAPILKVISSMVDIMRFQVFLIKLGIYGGEYGKLPKRFYMEEEQKHLEEIYYKLIESDSDNIIMDKSIRSFLFDDIKFKFPFLKDKLKFTNSVEIDPDNLRCSFMDKLGESLVLYDCEYYEGKITVKDEAYLDYIESFYFYFNDDGKFNEYNIYSPSVEDMLKINKETKRIAESIKEKQAIIVYSYVVYAILILDRNRIMKLAENTRNRKFIGKVIPENEVDYEKIYEHDSENKKEYEEDIKENEEIKKEVTIRKNSLNEEENRFLDNISPEEFRLLEDVLDINGVKVISLGNLFFKKMSKLMKGIRSLERVAPRYKVKSWAVRGYTRTSKNGVISYIEGGVRRRNTELLDREAIERQEKILSLDDVFKTTNIFEDK